MDPRNLLSKVKSPKQLRTILQRLKNQRTVFTNGCFDLLHRGHVVYLENAKKLGDLLIVALNSDLSVQAIKGPSRPLTPLEDRLQVMAALESVDFVTWFEEKTPLETIQLLKPNVLVKGGDWQIHQIIGSEDVLSWGGKVFSLSYIEGRSTTALIEKAAALQMPSAFSS